MSEMVERMVRAIMTANEQSTGLKYSDLCREMARAAIEAMRDPTDEMCSDGRSSSDDMSACGANNIWQAMIDAALK